MGGFPVTRNVLAYVSTITLAPTFDGCLKYPVMSLWWLFYMATNTHLYYILTPAQITTLPITKDISEMSCRHTVYKEHVDKDKELIWRSIIL